MIRMPTGFVRQGDPVNYNDADGLSRVGVADKSLWVCSLAERDSHCDFRGYVYGPSRTPLPSRRPPARPPASPQSIGHGTALAVQDLVRTGGYDECHGLAAYAADMATIFGDNANKFVDSFAALVPNISPLEAALGIKSTDDWVPLGVSGNSGLSEQFRDGYGTAMGSNSDDQSHHVAAFFQAGYFHLSNATAAAYGWELLEGTPSNRGDTNLGLAAATLGGLVRSGAISPADVADQIRKLCDK